MENVSPLILQRRTLTLARFTALLRDITSQSALTKKKKKLAAFCFDPFFFSSFFLLLYRKLCKNFSKLAFSCITAVYSTELHNVYVHIVGSFQEDSLQQISYASTH